MLGGSVIAIVIVSYVELLLILLCCKENLIKVSNHRVLLEIDFAESFL